MHIYIYIYRCDTTGLRISRVWEIRLKLGYCKRFKKVHKTSSPR